MVFVSVRGRIARSLFLPCLLLAFANSAHGQLVLFDGDFTPSDWVSKTISDTGNMDSYTAATETSGGNPGAYRHVIYTLQGGVLTVSHIPLNGSKLAYSPHQQGAIQALTYTYDVKVITGAAGHLYQLAVYQDGNTYTVQRTDQTDALTTWISEPVSSRLTSSAYFTKVDGIGPMHPDFSAGGSTLYFGYVTSNKAGSTSCYPYCYYTSGSSTLDTGIDNLTVNVFNGTPGVTCQVTPRNRFLPFELPTANLSQDTNEPLTVLVTSNGSPASGATLTVTSSQPVLSAGATVPPSLTTTATLTSDQNGQVVVYFGPPVADGFSQLVFQVTGSLGSQSFSCSGGAVIGFGTLSEPVQQVFYSTNSAPSSQPQTVASLRHVLANRDLLAYIPKRPKYRAALKKMLGPQKRDWTEAELRTLAEIAAYVEPHAGPQLSARLTAITADLDHVRAVAEAARRRREARELLAMTKEPHAVAAPRKLPGLANAQVAPGFGHVALSFEPNRGQAPAAVRYVARGRGYNLYLSPHGATLASNSRSAPARPVSIRFAGANPSPRITPLDGLPAKTNYLIGRNPANWHTGVPNYARVRYQSIYPGVDLVFYGREQQLEFDLVLQPGAKPGAIALDLNGVQKLEPDGDGGIFLRHAAGKLRLAKPVAYQDTTSGRTLVAGRYVIRNGNRVGFETGPYDPTGPLIIDPVVSWATYLGGSQFDTGMALAVDGQGNIYVAGSTASSDFPVVKPAQATLATGAKVNVDTFVTKLDPTGTQVLYSTYLGGSGTDSPLGIAVDSQGSAYVTGVTSSPDFPLMNPIQKKFNGGSAQFPADGFVYKLNSTGSGLVYSTYLGGTGDDVARSIAVDPSGNAYVAGNTSSSDFPLQNPLQTKRQGIEDAFVAQINPAGTALVFSTLLGGNNSEMATAAALDASGNIYVAGLTSSTDFPVKNAFQGSNHGSVDAFVTKLSPGGGAVVYSTYLGGESDDYALALALDPQGNAYITGATSSSTFPVQSALQSTLASPELVGVNAFIAKFDPTGAKLLYSTYLGGSGIDAGGAIAVGSDGSIFVAGETSSSDFPSSNALQTPGGKNDGFVAKLKPDGSALVYSTLLGGSGNDAFWGAALDHQGNLLLTGSSASTDFPVTYGGHQTSNHGNLDAIVLRVIDGSATPSVSTVSAASFQRSAASESIVTGFGTGLADSPQQAKSLPLPTELGTTSVSVKDSAGSVQSAPLFYVAPTQVNFLIPQGAAPGLAEVTVVKDSQTVAAGTVNLGAIAPALFSANSSGKGVAAALAQLVKGGNQSFVPVYQCGAAAGSCVAAPIDLSDPSTAVYLTLFGTGIQGRSSLTNVSATLGGISVPVLFAGPQGTYLGEDQVNLGPLPASLAGKGEVDLILIVDGIAANTVTIGIK